MNTQQQILEHIIDIKQDVGGIREHLKTLNSKVATNIINIEKNRSKIVKTDMTIAKWAGALSVIVFGVSIFLNIFFK